MIVAYGIANSIEEVNQRISQGWQPYGSTTLFPGSTDMAQPMVLEADDENFQELWKVRKINAAKVLAQMQGTLAITLTEEADRIKASQTKFDAEIAEANRKISEIQKPQGLPLVNTI